MESFRRMSKDDLCMFFGISILLAFWHLAYAGVFGDQLNGSYTSSTDGQPAPGISYSDFSIDDVLGTSARFKSERPNERNDKNDIVYCALRRISIDDIDVVHMEFTLTLTLEQYWEDHRLQNLLPNDSIVTYAIRGDSINKVWVPNLFFPLMKSGKFHELTTPNKIVFVNRELGVWYVSRLTLTQTCSLDLRWFPFDVQRCDTHLSTYMYTVDEIELRWSDMFGENHSESRFITNNLPQFQLIDENEPVRTSNFTIDEVYYKYYIEYSAPNASIHLYRETSSFILAQISVPFLLTVLSWINYFLDPEQAAARVSLGITTVLSAVTQASIAQRGLPQLSYNTILDIWTAICLQMTIFGLIEYAVVHILVFRAKRYERLICLQTTPNSVSPQETESYFITERNMDTHGFTSSERTMNDDRRQADLSATAKKLHFSALRYRLWAHRLDLISRIIMPVGMFITLCIFAYKINLF